MLHQHRSVLANNNLERVEGGWTEGSRDTDRALYLVMGKRIRFWVPSTYKDVEEEGRDILTESLEL